MLEIHSLFVWLVADGCCWFVLREKYCWLVAGGWFALREKYCWLVADKPSEQADNLHFITILISGWQRVTTFFTSNCGWRIHFLISTSLFKMHSTRAVD
jgi:hypothetical protein